MSYGWRRETYVKPAFPAGALLLPIAAGRNIAIILVLDAIRALLLGRLLLRQRRLLARIPPARRAPAARVLLGLQFARERRVLVLGGLALLGLLLRRRRVLELRQRRL